jgi:predicted RNA-binding Zn ribbon-like protein
MTSEMSGPTATDMEFKWLGGRTSLNFVATVGHRRDRAFERMPEPTDLAHWFRGSGLTDDVVDVSASDLAKARVLREAIYRLFTATRLGKPFDASDLAEVNRWTARPLPGTGLGLVRGILAPTRPDLDADGLLSLVARDATDLLSGPLARRIRECDRDDCTILFLDESRSGARRWCSMDSCGARSKMSTYRARREL